jgi:hypothetical protein
MRYPSIRRRGTGESHEDLTRGNFVYIWNSPIVGGLPVVSCAFFHLESYIYYYYTSVGILLYVSRFDHLRLVPYHHMPSTHHCTKCHRPKPGTGAKCSNDNCEYAYHPCDGGATFRACQSFVYKQTKGRNVSLTCVKCSKYYTFPRERIFMAAYCSKLRQCCPTNCGPDSSRSAGYYESEQVSP